MLKQKIQISVLLLIQIIFCFLFFNYTPIDFECDAALNFSYGKTIYNLITGNSKEIIVSYRPPGYQFFLILSGVYFFQTFNAIIFSNIAISFLIILLIYKSFINFGKNLAFALSLIYQLSLLPYLNIKNGFEMHLVNLFIIITFYSIINYRFNKKNIFIYLGTFSSIGATFTRFDCIFIIPIFFLTLFFIELRFNQKKNIKHFKVNFCFVILVFFLWKLAVSVFFYKFGLAEVELGNKRNFVKSFTSISLNHQTGGQLMWKFFNNDRGQKWFFDNKIDNFFSLDNGPESIKLYNELIELMKKKSVIIAIDSYKNSMYPLDEQRKNQSPQQEWNNHYNEIHTDPEKVAKRIFNPNFESHYYPIQIPTFIYSGLGRVQGDEILTKVSLEIMYKYKLYKLMFRNFFAGFGISFDPKNNTIQLLNVAGGYSWSNTVPFNGGNCAQVSLPKKMFDEYKTEYNQNNHIDNLNSKILKNLINNNMDFIRNVLGLFIIISIIVIFLFNLRFKDIILFNALSYISMNMLSSVFVETVSFKTESYTFSFLILNILTLIISIYYKLKDNKFR